MYRTSLLILLVGLTNAQYYTPNYYYAYDPVFGRQIQNAGDTHSKRIDNSASDRSSQQLSELQDRMDYLENKLNDYKKALTYGWKSTDSGSKYKLFTKTETFERAETICKWHDAKLINIDTEDKNNFVKDLFNNVLKNSDMPNEVWFGTKIKATKATSMSSSYTNFEMSQLNEGCLAMNTAGKWLLKDCFEKKPFVCQSDNFHFFDLNDTPNLDNTFADVRKLNPENTLTISNSLNAVRDAMQKNKYQDATIILTAANAGDKINDAIAVSSDMKSNGDQIIVMSLIKNNTYLDALSSVGKAIDATAILNNDAALMEQLSSEVTAIINEPPPVVTDTSAPTSSPSVTPTSTPLHYRIAILVQASSSTSQQTLVNTANFAYNNLIRKLQIKDNHESSVRIVPFAFDLSPDCEEYIPLNNKQDPLLKKQYQATKLSKITTFMAPLDQLSLGQVFNGLSDSEDKYPTHVITLINDQGNNFNMAAHYVGEHKSRTQFITVTTNPDSETFKSVSSTANDIIPVESFNSDQDLDTVAEMIAARVFPSTQRKVFKAVATTTSTTTTTKAALKPNITNSINPKAYIKKHAQIKDDITHVKYTDLIILLDSSKQATEKDSSLKDETDFAKELNNKFNVNGDSQKRIAIASYAMYLDADAELQNAEQVAIDSQVRRTQNAVRTTFTEPVNGLKLKNVLKELYKSPKWANEASSIVLLVSTASDDFDGSLEYAKNITDSGRKLVFVVLDGKTESFEKNSLTAVDGKAVLKGDKTTKDDLIKSILEKLNPDPSNPDHVEESKHVKYYQHKFN
uniref:C-type lectin domain-containing protein n=1 Tax=Syphacia muris TaxID=451379 RepID=A0A0N5ASH2_9BILA